MKQHKYSRKPFIWLPSLRQWLIIFLVWTVIGILFASQTYLELAYAEGSSSEAKAVVLSFQSLGLFLPTMFRWYVWALLTPLIFRLAEVFPLERPLLGRHLFSSTAVGLLITLAALIVMSLIQRGLGTNTTPLGINIAFPPHFLTFWAILGAGHLLRYQRQSREQAVQKAQLEAKLVQAQLQALRSQLNPHFLFNTLHAISATMYRDVEAADRMLARLSELLRLSLEEIDGQFSTLQADLHFLKLYLELEQVRFQDRLTVSITAPTDLLCAQVPTMLLQPLVENAVRYGIAPRAVPGQIQVIASCHAGQLVLEVADSGTGLPDAFTEGLGLTNTRSRLQQLYPDNFQFNLHNRSEGGLAIQIAFPFSPYQEQNGN